MAKTMKKGGSRQANPRTVGKKAGEKVPRKSLALTTEQVELLKKVQELELASLVPKADEPLFGFNRHSQIEKHEKEDPRKMRLPFKTKGRLLNVESIRLPCAGHSNYQMNRYLLLTGWERTTNVNALAKGNSIVVLAGLVRLFEGIYEYSESVHVYPKLLTDVDYSFLKQQLADGKQVFVIVTKDSVSGKWLDKRRELGRWDIPEEEEKVMILENLPAHIGVVIVKGSDIAFLDCNNFKGIAVSEKKKFEAFWIKIRTQIIKDLKHKLGITHEGSKAIRVNRLDSMYTNGINNACVVYCLYAIERLALDERGPVDFNYDMNKSTALCQLFALKVFCLVGGHMRWSLITFPKGGYAFYYENTLDMLAKGELKTFQLLKRSMRAEKSLHKDFEQVLVSRKDLDIKVLEIELADKIAAGGTD